MCGRKPYTLHIMRRRLCSSAKPALEAGQAVLSSPSQRTQAQGEGVWLRHEQSWHSPGHRLSRRERGFWRAAR